MARTVGLSGLTFGRHSLCQRCRRHDRRGRAYAPGWFWWPAHAWIDSAWRIIGYSRDGEHARIECPVCGGKGIIENE